MRRRVIRSALAALCFSSALVFGAGATPAGAHGENAQEAFLRGQSLAWFDVQVSKTQVAQGETLDITGRVRVLSTYPSKNVPAPEIAYLTSNHPGASFTVRDRQIGGKFAPMVLQGLEIGATYPFKVTLAGRLTGNFHVHPSIAVKGAGQIMGPGAWVKVTENPEYKNEIILASGKKVNLENAFLGTQIFWHVLMLLPGALLIAYWLIPKPILWRSAYVNADPAPTGVEDFLVSKTDHRITYGLGALALIVTLAGAGYSKVAWPKQIPLQVRYTTPAPDPEPEKFIDVETPQASFDPGLNSLTMKIVAKNNGTSPATLTSWHLASSAFINKEIPESLQPVMPGNDCPAGFSEQYCAVSGPFYFTLDQAAPLAPGERRTFTLKATSKIWTERRLVPEAEAQTQMGGALRFVDDTGKENLADVKAELHHA
jgi:methane/ammonia monooxygenase subunit B